MLVLFFLCMLCIDHHGHDHMTIVLEVACTVLFRTWWVMSACCWDESLKLMTWCGIQSLLLRWKLTTEEIAPPRLAAVLSVATGFSRSSFNSFFIQHKKNTFFVFLCQLIEQPHLKCLEVCFWIWEWFCSRDGNALYPNVKCPNCFSKTINKNKKNLWDWIISITNYQG